MKWATTLRFVADLVQVGPLCLLMLVLLLGYDRLERMEDAVVDTAYHLGLRLDNYLQAVEMERLFE